MSHILSDGTDFVRFVWTGGYDEDYEWKWQDTDDMVTGFTDWVQEDDYTFYRFHGMFTRLASVYSSFDILFQIFFKVDEFDQVNLFTHDCCILPIPFSLNHFEKGTYSILTRQCNKISASIPRDSLCSCHAFFSMN